MPPGTQVHFGFTEDQVRSMRPGSLLSVESEILYAVSGYAYTALTKELGDKFRGVAAIVSLVVAFDCARDVLTAEWAEVAGALWGCVAWNWDQIEKSIRKVGKHLKLRSDDVDNLVRRAVWISIALAAYEALSTIEEYVLDREMMPAEARVALKPPTRVVEISPITSEGSVDDDYFVTQVPRTLDCSFARASHASEEPGVYWCGFSSDGADVCWPDPTAPTYILCGTTPWSKRLLRWSVQAPPTTALPPPAQAVPWGLVLADGHRCRVRNGGSWGGRSDGFVGWYSCGRDGTVVLAQPNDYAGVVDESSDVWTVRIGKLGAPDDDFPPPRPVAVTTAFFADGSG